MTEIEKYIDKKVNSNLSDKQIPFHLIPESLKIFWTKHYKKNVIILMLLMFGTIQAQKAYVNTSFDVRNAVIGSDPTNDKPALDLLIFGGVMDKNGITLEAGYELFQEIEFQKLYFGLGYTYVAKKFEYSATIEPTCIYRKWDDAYGIYCYGSIGGTLKTTYKINDRFGISILGNCLLRTDDGDKYKKSTPKVFSFYAGVTYSFNIKK